MKFDKQDPRITAYALGEELNEADQTFIQEIESSEEFKQVVEEIQTTANAFSSLFAEEAPAAEPIEVDEVLRKVETKKKVINFPTLTRVLMVASGTMAACIVLGTIFLPTAGIRDEESREEYFIQYEEIPVGIPDEHIDGTPAPLNAPNLEHITEAPRMVVAREVAVNDTQTEVKVNSDSPDVQNSAVEFFGLETGAPQPSVDVVDASMLQARKQFVNGDLLGASETIAEVRRADPENAAAERFQQIIEERQESPPALARNARSTELLAETIPVTDQFAPPVSVSPAPQRARPEFADEDVLSAITPEPTLAMAEESVHEFPGSAKAEFKFYGTVKEKQVPEQEVQIMGFADGAPAGLLFEEPLPQAEPFNREGYDRIEEKDFLSPLTEPLSTFSIDVDTASYANVRRFIQLGQMPPPDAVRIEELINYFDTDYPRPEKVGEDIVPFSVNTDIMPAPWAPQHHLVRVGLQGYEIPWNERPASNLVFLVDVSGSMSSANKLGLVKKALIELSQKLDERDRVAIVTYAGSSGLALPSTTANNQATIEHALNNLKSGGSTNGAQGIQLAYQVAQEHFVEGGNNRVILCTDGDFNVGVSDRGQLTRLIEEKAKSGVFLSVCGFGMGNYQDGQMEHLSNKGNGNYAYIDSFEEAQKVFGEDLTGTLITIAKDVKIQVEFNPAHVKAYRLIGYENRALANEDFNDDTKDAGEIGAGHSVTALYEIIPTGVESSNALAAVDPLKYQTNTEPLLIAGDFNNELLTVKLRYKAPDSDTSRLISHPVLMEKVKQGAGPDMQFISAVAEFGLLLRGSQYAPEAEWKNLIERVQQSLSDNPSKERSDFLNLAKQAQQLKR
ncbi:MAG: vWA domain-containing protein [Opitutales bacterium]